jgi:hypothetical protein
MKFKDYLNSLVSRRKSSASSSKPSHHPSNKKHQQESTTLADCHYDICGYEDINSVMPDDLHSRTQILLARHADLVNTIVETRSSQDNQTPSCSQCRLSHQSSPMIPSLPPPLPPKLSFEQQTSFSNRNYSSTLATCSPRRECQQPPYYQKNLTSSQYSTPNPSVISSSSSLWTTTASLSKKQRSRIRTNPWIGKTSIYNRPSIRAESSRVFHHQTSPEASSLHPEYSIYDPTFNKSPSALIHSESFPQTTLNGNTHVITPPTLPPPPEPAPTSSVILHQSDSGQGFSLASSRVINSLSSSSSSPPSSSSSPDDTSVDGILSNEKQHYRQKKLKKKISSTSPSVIKNSPKRNINTEQNFCSNTISSDSGSLTRRKKGKTKKKKLFKEEVFVELFQLIKHHHQSVFNIVINGHQVSRKQLLLNCLLIKYIIIIIRLVPHLIQLMIIFHWNLKKYLKMNVHINTEKINNLQRNECHQHQYHHQKVHLYFH